MNSLKAGDKSSKSTGSWVSCLSKQAKPWQELEGPGGGVLPEGTEASNPVWQKKKKKVEGAGTCVRRKGRGKGKGEQHTWKAMQVPGPTGLTWSEQGAIRPSECDIEDACGPGPGNGGSDGGTYIYGP